MAGLQQDISVGFELVADILEDTHENVISELAQIKSMLSELVASNNHMIDAFEAYRTEINDRVSKIEKKAIANGARLGAA